MSLSAALMVIDDAISAATALHHGGRHHDAESLLREAIAHHPASHALHNACGVMQASQGRYRDAVASYRAALRTGSGEAAIWTNLGNALTHLRLLDSAVACHDAALARAPDEGGLHYNRGISLAEAGRHGEAVAAFSRALALAPHHGMAQWDRGRSYLHLGNLVSGWIDYDVRLRNGLVPKRAVPGRRWEGGAYAGQRLVLLAEQGFGDMLWVSRYLPLVRALGGELIVECPPELAGLYQSQGLSDRVVIQGEALPAADWHAWQCSLPGLFTRDLDSIAQPVAFVPDPARVAALRPVIEAAGPLLRVGIVWSGSVTFARNAERARPLEPFLDAFDQPGVQLFSLQKGPPEAELAQHRRGQRVIDLAPGLRGFHDTAAAMSLLDLVIMTDSAVAHLAGCMGKPVWVLLGANAHWLWLQDRGDTAWYPSMRLVRPRGPLGWTQVFDSASAELMRLSLRHAGLL